MDFFIPEPKMPTPANLREASIEWFKPLDGTCLDQLPEDVLNLGPKTRFLDLPITDDFIRDLHETELGTKSSVTEIARQLDDIFGWKPHVTKMSTRSPKDMWTNGGITISGKQAIAWMSGSMRIFDDMIALSHMQDIYTPKLCAREAFIPADGIPGSMEFRCFVNNGELIGVSDYDYSNPQVRPDAFWDTCLDDIQRWYQETLKPRMHLDTYVFDLVRSIKGWEFIEVNPYGLSDPCFYKDYASVENIGLSQGIIRSEDVSPDPESTSDGMHEVPDGEPEIYPGM